MNDKIRNGQDDVDLVAQTAADFDLQHAQITLSEMDHLEQKWSALMLNRRL
jgi:hypothetical protein